METKLRCAWCEKDDLYRNYHDNEWGKPVYDDETIFEFLILETFQAGLSWHTVLAKRENFRKAFDNFETQDDHGMHIVGVAKDQNGKEYYKVKNSWGDKNDYKGYLYVSKTYFNF